MLTVSRSLARFLEAWASCSLFIPLQQGAISDFQKGNWPFHIIVIRKYFNQGPPSFEFELLYY